MERCPTQAVLPLVGLAAEKVIRDRYNNGGLRPPRDQDVPVLLQKAKQLRFPKVPGRGEAREVL
ncbi:MAG: hypothetical protein ACQESR_14200 [Planctomycetota bacterium]